MKNTTAVPPEQELSFKVVRVLMVGLLLLSSALYIRQLATPQAPYARPTDAWYQAEVSSLAYNHAHEWHGLIISLFAILLWLMLPSISRWLRHRRQQQP